MQLEILESIKHNYDIFVDVKCSKNVPFLIIDNYNYFRHYKKDANTIYTPAATTLYELDIIMFLPPKMQVWYLLR